MTKPRPKHPMFTPGVTDDSLSCTPTGVLLIAADTAGNPSETTPEGIRNATSYIDAALSAARTSGYTQGDILHTLLARNQITRRVIKMAETDCDAAGNEALREIFIRSGLA